MMTDLDEQMVTPHSAQTGTDHVSDDVLFELLAAYQFLQGQNIRMSTELSTRLGIGPTDLRVLMYIERSPDVMPKAVAAQLKLTSGSVTALLDRLEQSGHVMRRPHPNDRRSLTIRLTPDGYRAVAAVRDAYRDAFAGAFSGEEITRVANVLRTLGTSIDGAIETSSRRSD